MYHLFEKDRDTHDSEAGEKSPEALRTTYWCCLDFANAVVKTCLFYH